MHASPLSPKASNPSSSLQNPESLTLKMKKRKSSRQLDHFVLSSTKIMSEFSAFKQQLQALEHSKGQYMHALKEICGIGQRKPFCNGPLPQVQYLQEESEGGKYRGRREANFIVQWQHQGSPSGEKYFENKH